MVRLDRITMFGFKSFANRTTIPFPVGLNVICGPNGSGKSARWDTEVILNNGDVRPIGEIVENALKVGSKKELDDGIYTTENPDNIKTFGLDPQTMKIVEKNISAFIKRKGEKHLYDITTKTGRNVVTTGCHPVMIFRENSVVSELVSNLKTGDLIATPRILNFPDADIKIPVPETGAEKCDGYWILHNKKKPFAKKVKIPENINENFARFLGYLIGDGCILPKANRCDLTNADNEIIEDFISIVKDFGLEVSKYEKKGKTKTIAINSSEMTRMLVHIFKGKIKKEQKHMPSSVLFAKKPVLANFLAALFDCDGTVRKDNPTFEYTTMSERLANQIQMALLRFGIVARKSKKMKAAVNTKEKTKKPYFYISIEGKDKLQLLYENIPLSCRHKKERLEKLVNKNIIPNPNADLLPQQVNNIIRECTKLLGIEYKPLRKKYPRFAAYLENRCCPTRDGLKEALNIFKTKTDEISREIKPEQKELLKMLGKLKIKRHIASSAIGLNKHTINTHWAHDIKAKQENLQKLCDFIRQEVLVRIKESAGLIKILESLSSSDIFWDKIKKIEKTQSEEFVYDLTIPNCHNFIGNGIFVHNSNVVDALIFVLGTSSARSIRAQKLQNLLFDGAKDRKSSDYSEVSLYIDNSDKKIPGEGDEVKITRKVSRAGVSVYKLNGRSVTRTEILDRMKNANLSPENYNIVMQGDVARIIEMSALERRTIIDDIAGISEF
ncbi:MAG: LAGLIDADG family homing endonuclease, partial [Candidatus Aenigmatarchaeota archaeon]